MVADLSRLHALKTTRSIIQWIFCKPPWRSERSLDGECEFHQTICGMVHVPQMPISGLTLGFFLKHEDPHH